MKKIFAIMLIIILLSAGIFLWKREKGSTHKDLEKPVFEKVKLDNISMRVSTTGHVVTNFDVDIKCKASGEVIRLPYDVSDRVKKGALLVELDPIEEERLVKQAEASLSASKARLFQARLNLQIAEKTLSIEKRLVEAAFKTANANAKLADAKLKRNEQLLQKRLISQEEFDTSETAAINASIALEDAEIRIEELNIQEKALDLKRKDILLAESQVKSDEISLSIAEQRLEDTKVFAPIDGVVSQRNVQIGQIISSGITNISGGTTVMSLSDLSSIFVLASVDESDIGNVRTGQVAEITADAFLDKVFSGEVIRIATKGVNTTNVVTFEVKLKVTSEERYLLKPEMTTNVEIVIDERADALLIPLKAVFQKDKKSYVKIKKGDGAIEERALEIGINDGEHIEIIKGLSEGEVVLIEDQDTDSKWRKSQKISKRVLREKNKG